MTTSRTASARRPGSRSAPAALVEDEASDVPGAALELIRCFLIERAGSWQAHRDNIRDAARPRRHDENAIGEENGLGDRVGDEHDGLGPFAPNSQQLEGHLLP